MISDAPDGAVVDVKVIPRAGTTTVSGTRDNAILVRLAAAPVDGAANAELIAFLAKLLDVPRRHVVLMSGEKSRSKRVKVLGLSAAALRRRLDASFDAG